MIPALPEGREGARSAAGARPTMAPRNPGRPGAQPLPAQERRGSG